MAANVVSKTRAYHGSQAGGFVDQVTLTQAGDTLIIENRSATVNVYFTYTTNTGVTPATPTNGGDNTLYVPAASFRAFSISAPSGVVVYLIGDANAMAYSIEVI